jgi:hypothetical protein
MFILIRLSFYFIGCVSFLEGYLSCYDGGSNRWEIRPEPSESSPEMGDFQGVCVCQ